MQFEGLYWMLLAIQLVAIAAAWMARTPTSSRGQWACFGTLAVLGLSVVVSWALFPSTWPLSAMVFGLAVLLATWDAEQGELLSRVAESAANR